MKTIYDIPEQSIDSTPDLYTPLQRALIQARVPVLAERAVKRYQDRARRRLALRNLAETLPLALLFLAAGVGGGWAAGRLPGILDPLVGALAGCSLTFGIILTYVLWTTPLAQWMPTAPGLLPGSIPTELLDRAAAVLSLAPDSLVYAEVLVDDPFLVVQSADRWEKYYIGVWDESGWR
jgi:hypothetical protein